MGETVDIHWKCFSLEQANSSRGQDFKLWEHPETHSRSLLALQAAKCAQLQGDDRFNPFHLLLFEALHLERKDITSEEVLKEIAGKAHLDIPKFMEDLRSDASRQQVGQDHMEAVESYRVFGVPTLVINQKWPFFVKLGSLPDSAEEKVSVFKEVRELIINQPCILEIKRT